MSEQNWREIASKLYDHVAKEWCWHCGATLSRHYKADEALEEYRAAVDND